MNTLTLLAVLLLAAPLAWAQGAPKSSTLVHDLELAKGSISLSSELEYIPGVGVRPTKDKVNGFSPSGTVTFAREKAPLPFNDLILSWNLDLPERTGARIEVRALNEAGESTAWYEIARIGAVALPDERRKKDDFGHIAEDTLMLAKTWDSAEYRVTLFTSIPHRAPTLRLMAACYSDTGVKIPYVATPAPKSKQPWMRSLPARWRAQGWEESCIAGRICGPTSMSVSLEYHGCKLPTSEVAAEAFDDYNGIFGNWPFLAQVAAKHGLKAWVVRCQDFSFLEQEIAAGRPVVVSIKYSNHELSNSPIIDCSMGHLMAAVGFNRAGDLLCNDSAETNPRCDHIAYKRSEMAKAWLDQGGVAICLIPRKK